MYNRHNVSISIEAINYHHMHVISSHGNEDIYMLKSKVKLHNKCREKDNKYLTISAE